VNDQLGLPCFLEKSKQVSEVIRTERVIVLFLFGHLCSSDMDDLPKVLYGWSWEENKLFEMALAVVDEEDPDRWKVVAAMVGGKKSEEDVQKHYVILLEDLQGIESGKLDHKLVGEAQPCVQVDCTESVCWTDEDHKYVVIFTC
jgi:hypothetical protein